MNKGSYAMGHEMSISGRNGKDYETSKISWEYTGSIKPGVLKLSFIERNTDGTTVVFEGH